jgi:hypothetical protein
MDSNLALSAFKQAMVSGTIVAHGCSEEGMASEWSCSHEFGDAPDDADLQALQALDAASREALLPLYSVHAGGRFFVVDGAPGVVLAAPAVWNELAEEMSVWWRDVDEDDIDADLREMLASALVIGAIEESATYFVLVRAGELKGHIALFCHDGMELISLAASFNEFLELLPAKGIDWMHADVRYFSTETLEQYYPVAFRPGGRIQPSRYTLRVAIESRGSANTARYEFAESTDTEVEIIAPSGNRYSLVVEFQDDCSASISVDAEDGESSFYFSGSGTMKIQSQFAAGDIFNGDIALRVG